MTWRKELLRELPAQGSLILSADERMESYREDTMTRGNPDAVLVAQDEQELREALPFCNAHGIPVTLCGSQTSMTGSSVPEEGLLISTEKLEGMLDLHDDPHDPFVIVRPGTIVADLQKAVADAGFFYPVAPTSRDECRIGANLATNATGEDSFKYGPVRLYVRSASIILPDGSERCLERAPNERPSRERNRAGYLLDWRNPLDLIIGSEGTLAAISQVTLRLLPSAPDFFAALIPLPSDAAALEMVLHITMGDQALSPRALELIDSGALKLMRTASGFPALPDEVQAFLYIKQEYTDLDDRDRWLSRWYELSLRFSGEALMEHLLIALSSQEQETFRLWRHRIPEAANEFGRAHWAAGGGKVGSDWWVPLPKLQEMMRYFTDVAEATGLTYMGYAHIGAGHPHTNFLARNADEMQKAHEALIACCRKAVALGGGVAGEHGIGRLHADQLAIQHSAEVIQRMRSWKRAYDPNWILGRGTIFRDAEVS